MFFGFFIVIAGIISLLEAYSIINSDIKWGIPLAVICFGLSMIWNSIPIKQKKNTSH